MGTVFVALYKFSYVICSSNCRSERLLVFLLLGNPLQLAHDAKHTNSFLCIIQLTWHRFYRPTRRTALIYISSLLNAAVSQYSRPDNIIIFNWVRVEVAELGDMAIKCRKFVRL